MVKPLADTLPAELLLVWHWALALNLLACPPASSQLNIGYWIREDHNVSEHQKWIKAYTCVLQHLAEVSVGHSWTTEGQAMTPEVTKLVDNFLAAMGMHVSPHIIRECWPMLPDDIPQQNLDGVCMWSSCTALGWSSWCGNCPWWCGTCLSFPKVEEDHWKEGCLLYYPGKVVNIGVWMPWLWLVIQDIVGWVQQLCVHTVVWMPNAGLWSWHFQPHGVGANKGCVDCPSQLVELKSTNDLSNIFPCLTPWGCAPLRSAVPDASLWPACRAWNGLG